jgi:hypothetical protein
LRTLDKFNELPDDVLNTRVWNTAARVSATLGSVAQNIQACLDSTISYEECLARIADSFLDRPQDMERSNEHLTVVAAFLKGADLRHEIESYLALCDPTDSDVLEDLKERLLARIDRSYSDPSDANNRELGYLWTKFKREYAEHFAASHDAVMRSHGLQEKRDEFMRSDDWYQFKALLPMNPCAAAWPQLSVYTQHLAELDCANDVRQSLNTRPFCTCSFSLPKVGYWNGLPDTLAVGVAAAVRDCSDMLAENRGRIAQELEAVAKSKPGDSRSETAKSASKKLSDGTPFNEYAAAEFKAVAAAAVAALPELHRTSGSALRTSPIDEVRANA